MQDQLHNEMEFYTAWPGELVIKSRRKGKDAGFNKNRPTDLILDCVVSEELIIFYFTKVPLVSVVCVVHDILFQFIILKILWTKTIVKKAIVTRDKYGELSSLENYIIHQTYGNLPSNRWFIKTEYQHTLYKNTAAIK